MKYEYFTCYVGDSNMPVSDLNSYYKEGWEPILSSTYMEGVVVFTLRRWLKESPPRLKIDSSKTAIHTEY